MSPDILTATDLLDLLAIPHRGGHQCMGATGRPHWVPHRDICDTLTSLTTIGDTLTSISERTHAAAHDPEAVDAVVIGMLDSPLADLPPEAAEGWRYLARQAIEALAHHLDN